jgi:hypothetical protein
VISQNLKVNAVALGLNDLRELFSYDIENVRLRRTGNRE